MYICLYSEFVYMYVWTTIVILVVKTSLEMFSLRREHVWTCSV